MVSPSGTGPVGAAIQDGYIADIDNLVVRYLPGLGQSAYDGVTVRQLLQMTSGVARSEAYTDPASDRWRMLEAQIAQKPGVILDLMASQPRASEPGSIVKQHSRGAVTESRIRR